MKKASAFFARAELDPLSPVFNLNLARALRTAGKPEEAVERARRAIEIEPGFANAHGLVSDIYSEELNQPDEAVRYQKKAAEVDRLIPSSRTGVLAQALLLPSRAAASS